MTKETPELDSLIDHLNDATHRKAGAFDRWRADPSRENWEAFEAAVAEEARRHEVLRKRWTTRG